MLLLTYSYGIKLKLDGDLDFGNTVFLTFIIIAWKTN